MKGSLRRLSKYWLSIVGTFAIPRKGHVHLGYSNSTPVVVLGGSRELPLNQWLKDNLEKISRKVFPHIASLD